MNKFKKNVNRSFIPQTFAESLKSINDDFESKFGKIDFIVHSKWHNIVGPFFANHSKPIKIHTQPDYTNDNGDIIYLNFLHVNVSPAAAIEFQHFKDKIIEKINSFVGYKAINGIKMRQTLVSGNLTPEPRIKKEKLKINNDEINKKINNIKNKELEKSVVKLGISISNEENK